RRAGDASGAARETTPGSREARGEEREASSGGAPPPPPADRLPQPPRPLHREAVLLGLSAGRVLRGLVVHHLRSLREHRRDPEEQSGNRDGAELLQVPFPADV